MENKQPSAQDTRFCVPLPSEEAQMRWKKVLSYRDQGDILQGTVVEVRPSRRGCYAVVKLEGFDVLIPDTWFISDDFFNSTFEKADDQEKARRRFQCLRAAIGANVPYLIRQAVFRQENGIIEYTVLASRLDAAGALRHFWFYSGEVEPERQIRPGRIIPCDVLTVGENGVRAQCCGVDFYINRRQLSLLHPILDARDWFSPGDRFSALVQKLYANEDGSVYLQASVRQMEHERIKDGYLKAHQGSIVAGYVCDYNSEKHSYTIVLSCGCYANCHRNAVVGGETLALGDSVSVQIKEIRTGFVTGSCMRINDLSGPRNMLYSWD